MLRRVASPTGPQSLRDAPFGGCRRSSATVVTPLRLVPGVLTHFGRGRTFGALGFAKTLANHPPATSAVVPARACRRGWDGLFQRGSPTIKFLNESFPNLSKKEVGCVDESYQELQSEEFKRKIEYYGKQFTRIKDEMKKIVVGQHAIVDSLIEALLANGHVLVEGIPGVGKTLIIRTLAKITGAQFSRIQFTPDLLPTDIVGITTYEEGKGFFTVKGPIFSNFVLADEINRSPPKVQSALLESMQERQATIGKETFQLPAPFFVMATQNPIEQLGTYKLPEAQVDRFLFKLLMTYPTPQEEISILKKNITLHNFSEFELEPVLSTTDILNAQHFVKRIYLNRKIEEYIVRVVEATREPKKYNIEMGKYIGYGASPRSSIALYIAGKAHALVNGRGYVTPQDVKEVAYNVLRHRILLNFEGEAEEMTSEEVIKEILEKVPIL